MTHETPEVSLNPVSQEVIVPVDGRVPPPSVLERYEQVLPGSADRVLKMAEAEQAHRHAIDSQAAQTDSRVRTRRLAFGFTLAVMGVSLGAVLGGMWLIMRLFWARRARR
jgi:uncharacterized membrane protein